MIRTAGPSFQTLDGRGKMARDHEEEKPDNEQRKWFFSTQGMIHSYMERSGGVKSEAQSLR